VVRKKVKAAALTTASRINQPDTLYQDSITESKAKLHIGKLLLFLCLDTSLDLRQRKAGWQVLDRKLRDHFQAKNWGCE